MSKTDAKSGDLSATRWLPLLALVVVSLFGWALYCKNKAKIDSVDEAFRFVNNNSALCTHNFQQHQIDCVNVDTDQVQTIEIPDEYQNLTSIQPSHDGTKFLLTLYSDPNDRYLVTDFNFENPQDIAIPYGDASEAGTPPQIIWGSNSNKLIISKQVREETDADFLPAPLVVWDYDVTTKESKRIFKNGDDEESAIKVVGASDEYLFITQPVYKNWVATDTDPPADALLAIRLDDGFVRVVNIEQLVKHDDRNKYASGIYIDYDPTVATFYISGQNQISETDYINYYTAAELVDNNGLVLHELSSLASEANYYGVTSTKGTLVSNWSYELDEFQYSLVATPNEMHDVQNFNPDRDNPKFTILSLPNAE